MERDEKFMREALRLAEYAGSLGEAPVGCVVVLEDEIIGRGYNLREKGGSALAHAEISAIEEACRHVGGWRLCGCELFVTLEPCPMCAGACINSRIERVVFGAYDEKAGSLGTVVNLFELPYNHKPEICGGILEGECSKILSDFFSALREKKKSNKNEKKVEF